MPYDYIGLFAEDAERASVLDELIRLGMRPRGQVGRVALFAPDATPVASLPGGGLCVGKLYDNHGREADLTSAFPRQAEKATMFRQLLERFWGQYVVLLPADDGSGAVSVLRDPSGAVGCAFQPRAPCCFLTSSVGIAAAVGLYRSVIDWTFIQHCVAYPHLKLERTGLAGLQELLPGSAVTLTARSHADSQAMWTPWQFLGGAQHRRDPATAAGSIREAVTKVVDTLASEDGSLLLELSGGLDSSIVGACLARTAARVPCCTAVTPLRGADERRYAALIAELLDVELRACTLDFDDARIDFPVPASSLRPAVWALSRSVGRIMDEAAEHAKVSALFSGGGGDTVFAYLTTASPAADAFRAGGLAEGFKAVANLSRLHGCTVAKAAWLTLRKLYRRPHDPPAPDTRFLSANWRLPSLTPHPWFSAPRSALVGDRERVLGLIGTQLFGDATPRGGGRRVRMPLLAQPVVEACLRVPSWMWIDGGRNRAIARDAFSEALPEAILNRRSKGTFMNYTASVYRRSRQTIASFLLDGSLQAQGLLDRAALERYLTHPPVARDDTFMRLFDLCMIENWVRHHR